MTCFKINDLNENLGKISENEILKELKNITISHQKAIQTARKLEKVLKYQMLVQVIVNSFFICIVGFDVFAVLIKFLNFCLLKIK